MVRGKKRSRRPQKQTSCKGKIGHTKEEAAEQVRVGFRKRGVILAKYKCRFCEPPRNWHIGHAYRK